MKCKHCGSDTKVYKSFSDDSGVFRMRKCLYCNYRFATTEIESDSKHFYKLQSDYQKKDLEREDK